jgi:hypothetical protein
MLNKNIPEYFTSRENIISHLIFVFLFSLLFVNIFTPFQGAWYNIQHYSRGRLFTDTLAIVSGGTMVLLISRAIMNKVHKNSSLNYLQYVFWLIVEVFVIAFLYAIIVHFVVKDTRNFSEIFTRAVFYVPSILIIPTVISHLYMDTKHKDEKISELESRKSAEEVSPTPQNEHGTPEDISFSGDFAGEEFVLDNHITPANPGKAGPAAGTPSPEPEQAEKTAESTPPGNKIINFFDEKEELQLSLRLDDIYFIESAENYVKIHYRNKENTERFTLRSSMKKQQEKLEKYGFIRCHRSYLVNFENIALLRKDKDGPYLDFGAPNLPQIPVSKTYLDSVTAYFINNSDN